MQGLSAGPVAQAWGDRSSPTSRHPALYERWGAAWSQRTLPPDIEDVLGATSDMTGRTLVVGTTAAGITELLSASSEGPAATRQLAPLRDPLTVETASGLTLVGTSAGKLTAIALSTAGTSHLLPTLATPGARTSLACAGAGAGDITVGLDKPGGQEVATLSSSRWSVATIRSDPEGCLDVAGAVLILETTQSPDGGTFAERVSGTGVREVSLPAAVTDLVSASPVQRGGLLIVAGPTQAVPANIFETTDATMWRQLATPATGPASEVPTVVALDSANDPCSLTVSGRGAWTYNVGRGGL